MATARTTNLMLEGEWSRLDGVRAGFMVTVEGVWGQYWGDWSDIWVYGWRMGLVGERAMRLVRGDSMEELWHRVH